MQAYAKKLRWSDGSGSDLFAILKAYRVSIICLVFVFSFFIIIIKLSELVFGTYPRSF